MTENPYRNSKIFVGRTSEMAEIRSHLSAGQSTLLIGGRRTGKSSLAARLTGLNRPLIALDAQPWKLDSEETVLNEIGAEVDRAFGFQAGQSYTRDSLTQRFKELGPLSIIIDEADRILSEPWAGPFLFYLRWLDDTALRSTISFLLIGGPSLAEYRNPDDHGSPPLNTADPVYLEPLTVSDISEMMQGMSGDVTLGKVMREGGGHPWLLNKLLAEVYEGKKFQAAVDRVWELSVRNFKVWHRQVGDKGVNFLRALPDKGIGMSEFRTGKMTRHREGWLRCRYTCLVKVSDRQKYQPGPKLFLDWLSSEQPDARTWDLAISYASEDLALAKTIYDSLHSHAKIFFAPSESAYLWGQDLNRTLPHTYGVDARFVLVLSSPSYVKKHWTGVEFNAALEKRTPGSLLVVNLGQLPPNFPSDLVFMESDPANLIGLLDNLKKKLGIRVN